MPYPFAIYDMETRDVVGKTQGKILGEDLRRAENDMFEIGERLCVAQRHH
jgi:hypothetical protein